MPLPLIAAGLTAAGTIASGIMERQAAKKQNRQQVRAIQRANERTEKREDNRIQRIVMDARAAGIHPLAALGSPSVGTFATPQAAYGGAPISGSAVGDALQGAAQVAGAANLTNSDNLQQQLLRAQIRNVDASTANMLADARSRTNIQAAGDPSAVTSGPPGTIPFFGWDIKPGFGPKHAQTGQDAFGDMLEQIFGLDNFQNSSFTPNLKRMGPLSADFWSWWNQRR